MKKLAKIVGNKKKRVGRGHGSGKVKTAGRGTKGQNARDSIRFGIDGGQARLVLRLPFLRGKGKNHSRKEKPTALPLARLSLFDNGAVVNLKTMREKHLISSDVTHVKLIGNTGISKKLTIEGIGMSEGAKKAVVQAGGTVQ